MWRVVILRATLAPVAVRASVEERFSHRRMVSAYEDVYRRVLAGNARREA